MVQVVRIKKPILRKKKKTTASSKQTTKKKKTKKKAKKKKSIVWAKPEGAKHESFEKPVVKKTKKEGAAGWATPKDVKAESFHPAPVKKTVKKKGAHWATLKKPEGEDFGPVGTGEKKKEEKIYNKVFKKLKTGVPGLDEILEGGIPENSLVTVSGGPGSGKTIMCLQYIYYGWKKYKEPGVFISLEEEPERLIKVCKSFGWDIEKYIKQKKILLVKTPLYKFESLKAMVRDSINRIGAKRLVIDPGALLDLFFERPIEVRKAVVELGNMLKKTGCTTLITTEEEGGANFNQEDFSSDGIIFTYYTKVYNQFNRMIAIIKMRGTDHSEKIHPLRFTDKGLEVMYTEEVFEEVKSVGSF